jgi:hypothetical protein
MRLTMPATVAKPARPPEATAVARYIESETPSALVHFSAIPRPTTCPRRTNSRPKWNNGLFPQRGNRRS